MSGAIFLSLSVQPGALVVAVGSRGETIERLWTRTNSWGWSNLSLLLAPPNLDRWKELTAKPVRHTRNVPRAIDLPPGGKIRYELRRGEPSWDGMDALRDWLSGPLRVRGRLRIPETPEAIEQSVFIGEILSTEALSQPPHDWLI
jgi:hypothetical protein